MRDSSSFLNSVGMQINSTGCTNLFNKSDHRKLLREHLMDFQ